MKYVKMTEEEATLIATTLEALSSTFKRESGYNTGYCTVNNIYPEDLDTYAEMANRIYEALDHELY